MEKKDKEIKKRIEELNKKYPMKPLPNENVFTREQLGLDMESWRYG